MKRPADSTSDVPAPALRQEALLFDELVRRPDSLLNPLASARQLMVNDVLTLVRRYTQTRLLSTVDWKQGEITGYEIDTDTLRPPVNLCGFEREPIPERAAWCNGWVTRTTGRKFQYFPVDNTVPSYLDFEYQPETQRQRFLCRTTGAGALVTYRHEQDDRVTFQALRDAAPETKLGPPVSVPGLAMSTDDGIMEIYTIGENHLFSDLFSDDDGNHYVEIVDLVAIQSSRFQSHQVPWETHETVLQTPRPLVVEVWSHPECAPGYIVDCRQELVVDLNPQFDERLGDVGDFVCAQLDDYTVACIGSRCWYADGKRWMQFFLYDRRALRHSIVRAEKRAYTYFQTPIFHVSEPLNVIN